MEQVRFSELTWRHVEYAGANCYAAFFAARPPPKAITPLALRAPEVILNQALNSSIDIWSFGCLMYEFLTGETLFGVMMFGNTQEDADDDHLIQLHNIVRPLSDSIMSAWPGASTWFDADGNPVPQDDEHGDGAAVEIEGQGELYVYDTLEQRFAKAKPADIDDEEAAIVCKLIREMLAYDPAERPSATELLKHPWFLE